MFKHLFKVKNVTAAWGPGTLSAKPIEGSFRFITCYLVLHLEDGTQMKNDMPNSLGGPLFRARQEQDASILLDRQASSVQQTNEEISFDNAWQIVEKSYSIASWNDDSSKAEAFRLLTAEASISALSAFVQSSTWKRNLDSPLLVILPGLGLMRGVLYRGSVWSYDANIEMRDVFKKIVKLYELSLELVA